MPTRKQRRRELKSKRHQYEFVYVDAEGNELDEAPPELLEEEQRRKRTNGAKAAASAKGKKQPPSRGGRREPQWNRAIKRSLILAAFFFIVISFGARGNLAVAVIQALPIALLYIPLMYYIDRWTYRRYQAKLAGGATPARKKG
jgi:Ca2+/H+ antiporter